MKDELMKPSNIEAYRLGLLAARDGLPQSAGPYVNGSRASWFTGWYEGKHEKKFGWKPRWE